MGEDQDKCPGRLKTHSISHSFIGSVPGSVCVCACALCLLCNEYLETVGKQCCSSRDCRHYIQRLQVTETLGPGVLVRGMEERLWGRGKPRCSVVVCPRAPRPQQVWSVVELGSYVLGKAQPHLSTYGP